VAMKQIGLAEYLGGFQDGPAKKSKPFRVVVVVAQRSSVQGVTVEKWRVVDEVKLHAIPYAAVEHRAESVAIVERDRDAADHHLRVIELGQSIPGKVDRDFVSESR
jgi:hypothetical protein